MSANSVEGTIPSEISKLRNLINLNLQDNQLTGSIPVTIGDLNSLLDLSNNSFSGEVSDFLTTMDSLTRLLLSNNQLSGILPSFKQFVIVETTGNKDLRNASTPDLRHRRNYSAIIAIVVAVVSAIVAIGIVWIVVLVVSRRYHWVNDESFPEGEHPSPSRVINGHMITTNNIHRSGIDFTAAMQAVSDPTNILLKTRFSTYYNVVMPSGTNYYVKKQELEVLGRLNNSNIMKPFSHPFNLSRPSDPTVEICAHEPPGPS